MHVDTSRGGIGGNFPGTCSTGAPLSANEAAFEYLFFELSACNVGGAPIESSSPPAPPAPTPLTPVTITHSYQAICPAGTEVEWGALEWQANVPAGTKLSFTAATAPNTDAGTPGTFGPAVPVGAVPPMPGPNNVIGGWTMDSCPVSGHLEDLAVYGSNAACTGSTPASDQTSGAWLQVSITLTPSAPAADGGTAGNLAPSLSAWNVLYDCVPSE